MRQHRLHRPGHVDARGSPARLAIEQRALSHIRADVGDVHPHAHAAVAQRLRGDGIVEVARGGGVDRDGGQAAQVAPDLLASRLLGDHAGLPLHRGIELARQPAVEHHRLDHVTSDIRPSQHTHNLGPTPPRAAPPVRGRVGLRSCSRRTHEHELPLARAALARRRKPVRMQREAAARGSPRRLGGAGGAREQRLGYPEASAAREHRDQRLAHRRRLTEPPRQASSAQPAAPFRCRSGWRGRRFPG